MTATSVVAGWVQRSLPARLAVVGLLVVVGCLAPAGRAAAQTPALALVDWGANGSGQLGNGSTTDALSPAVATGLPNVTSVSGGSDFTLAVSNGTVWAWGDNSFGQLGDGTTIPSSSPVQVPGLYDAVQVAAGADFGLALLADGTVWAWGGDAVGELGNGTTTASLSPVEVSGLSNVVAIAAGLYDGYALLSDGQGGTVDAWGYNAYGQLGDGTSNAGSDVPVAVSGLGNVTAIAAGDDTGYALASGTVEAWGDDDYGQLGDGATSESDTPVSISGLSNVTAIAGGGLSAYALADGSVSSWGYNAFGELGNGSTTNSDVPVPVSGLSSVTAIAAGTYSAYALANGSVIGWGDGEEGELGNGSTGYSPVPVTVPKLPGVTALWAGTDSAQAYASAQQYVAFSWTPDFEPAFVGSTSIVNSVTLSDPYTVPVQIFSATLNAEGTDGDEFKISDDGCSGTTIPVGGSCQIGIRFSPLVAGPATARLSIDSGTFYGPLILPFTGPGLSSGVSGLSFSLVPDPVFGAGLNGNGQLGDGGVVNAPVPVGLAAGSGSFVAVSAGGSHSLGLEANGTVWAWGADASGQLGDLTTIDEHTPVQVPLPSGITAVSAGLSHSLALRSDGTVWAWGSNVYGQLGNGSTTASSIPVEVQGLSNVVAIAAGGYHSLALRSDGTVWAWGANVHGELGNGGLVNSSVPVQVSSLSGVVAIAAGQYHSLALTAAGKVYAWGLGSDGQIGDGLFSSAAVPQSVSGLSSGVVGIAAGADHSLALLSGGTVDAWGDDSNGQLGNASTTNLDAPVAVSGLTGVRQISAGSLYSLAVNGSGQGYGWGQNNDGQLGIGSTTDKHTPTLMTSVGNGVGALGSGSEGNHTLFVAQPYASLNPASGPIAFTAPGVGQSSTSLTETVTNTGLVALVFGQAAITGQDGDEFVITGDGCSNSSLAPGGSCVIGLRYNEKVSETNPAATLRIPSNSPTSPSTITLDPPAAVAATPAPAAPTAPQAHAAALACAAKVRGRATRTLLVSCRLAAWLPAGRKVLRARLTGRGRRAVATASARTGANQRTVTLRLRLPARLSRGRYTVTVTTAGAGAGERVPVALR